MIKQLPVTLTAIMLLLVGAACVPEQTTQEETDEKASVNAIVITGDATDIAPTSVKISGTVAIVNAKEANGKAYFFISETKGDIEVLKKGKSIEAGVVASDGNSFSVTVENLSPSTEYFYAAAVSIDGKEFTGSVKTFTTAEKPKELTITGAASDITEISARLTGYANPTPEMGNVTMGVVYSTNESPSLDNGTEISSRELDGNNMYTVIANGLSSNTTYYYKSFVQYGGVYRYGEVKSFKTLEVKASVETISATDITEFRTTLNGRLTVESTQALEKSVWFIFGQSFNTLEEIKTAGEVLITDLNEDGTFHYSLDNLDYDEEYCFIAVAKVHDILLYGDVISVSTKSINATVETNEVTDITELRATLNGKLVVDSNENMSQSVWFLYSKTVTTLEELKQSGEKTTAILAEDGLFSCNLTNLEPNTDYKIVAVARVHDKEFYGEPSSFRTLSINVDLDIDVTQIEEFKATLNANLAVNTKESFDKQVWFIISDKEVPLEELKTIGTWYEARDFGDGSYQYTVKSQLSYNTSYYYTALAKVYNEEFYSEVKSFTTLDFNASINTGDVWEGDVGAISAQLYAFLIIEAVSPYYYFSNTKVWMYISDSDSTLEDLITKGTIIEGTDDTVYHSSYSPYSFYYTFPTLECTPNTEYYYVACANVAGKEVYGEVKSFKTKEVIVNIETGNSTDVGSFYATVHGTLETENLEEFSKEDSFYYSDSNSDIEGLKRYGKKVSANLDGINLYANLEGLLHNTTYYYVACTKLNDYEYYGSVESFTTDDISEETDLGLSVKWRSWNVGASSPEEYGNYYAWGEIEPKSSYYESNYTWGSSISGFTKYNAWDNRRILEKDDDVAQVELGNKWRMPTSEEWTELITNCTFKSMKINGVFGYLAIGQNGKSIFFPAAGYKDRTLNDVGVSGYHWSSQVRYDNTASNSKYYTIYAYCAFIGSNTFVSANSRYLGYSIRPVTE